MAIATLQQQANKSLQPIAYSPLRSLAATAELGRCADARGVAADNTKDMDTEQFWNLIEQSRQGSTDCDEQGEKLTDLLALLDPQEIIEFDREMFERRIEAYHYDLWAVAYIINGGCSDDGFEYFRCWLISQGREFFEAVLKEPERAADRVVEDEDAECEPILYASSYAYERKTGQEMSEVEYDYPEPKGENWTEDDLERLYPDLCERFG